MYLVVHACHSHWYPMASLGKAAVKHIFEFVKAGRGPVPKVWADNMPATVTFDSATLRKKNPETRQAFMYDLFPAVAEAHHLQRVSTTRRMEISPVPFYPHFLYIPGMCVAMRACVCVCVVCVCVCACVSYM